MNPIFFSKPIKIFIKIFLRIGLIKAQKPFILPTDFDLGKKFIRVKFLKVTCLYLSKIKLFL